MADVHEVPRRRIATGHLAQHIGQPVCFVGRVEKVRDLLRAGALCGEAAALPGASWSRPGLREAGGPSQAGGGAGREVAVVVSVGSRGGRPPFELTGPVSFVDSP